MPFNVISFCILYKLNCKKFEEHKIFNFDYCQLEIPMFSNFFLCSKTMKHLLTKLTVPLVVSLQKIPWNAAIAQIRGWCFGVITWRLIQTSKNLTINWWNKFMNLHIFKRPLILTTGAFFAEKAALVTRERCKVIRRSWNNVKVYRKSHYKEFKTLIRN